MPNTSPVELGAEVEVLAVGTSSDEASANEESNNDAIDEGMLCVKFDLFVRNMHPFSSYNHLFRIKSTLKSFKSHFFLQVALKLTT